MTQKKKINTKHVYIYKNDEFATSHAHTHRHRHTIYLKKIERKLKYSAWNLVNILSYTRKKKK